MKLHCDKQFEPAVDQCIVEKDPIAKENYYDAGDRAPRVERNNRMIQEWVRASYHQISRIHFLRALVRAMKTECMRKLKHLLRGV